MLGPQNLRELNESHDTGPLREIGQMDKRKQIEFSDPEPLPRNKPSEYIWSAIQVGLKDDGGSR